MYTQLIYVLRQAKVINQDNSLNVRFISKLNKFPELNYKITEATSFLEYNACLKVRLHCIIQGITQQPLCESCGAVLQMRTDGVYRYTFPTFCSNKCLSNNKVVKSKKHKTNKQRYGHEHVVASSYVRGN